MALALSPDGSILASSGGDSDGPAAEDAIGGNTVCLWEVGSGKPLFKRRLEHTATTVAFSPDGGLLAVGGEDKLIRLWSASSGKEVGLLRGHTDTVRWVQFAPQGGVIASGGEDNTVRIWDVATRKELRQFTGHVSRVNAVSFAPDGKSLASASNDGTVLIWKVEDDRR
jgi:WD40 repeat protein